MSSASRVVVIAGSTREGSFAKQLGRAAATAVEAAGGQSAFVDLRDFEMPLYDGDLEEADGLPAGAIALRDVVKQHDAVLFATPEYNSSISAVLKNAIDWLSRPYAAEPDVAAWAGKVCGLLASSPGGLGGLRGLVHLRQIAMNVGMQVVTEQFALGSAHEAFAGDGSLSGDRARAGVQKVVDSVLRMSAALRGA